jgi:hypothetical protein
MAAFSGFEIGAIAMATKKALVRSNGSTTREGVIVVEDIEGVVLPPKRGRTRKDSDLDEPTEKATAADHLAALESGKGAKSFKQLIIPPLDVRSLILRIIGDAPLIVHRFSEKARRQMLDKQMGVASEGRQFKNPEEDFRDSLYIMANGRHGFPAIAFKNACVTACTSTGKAITKVAARQAFHVVGDLIEIEGTPTMREDTVRIGAGIADIRHRGEFREWACRLLIRYNARVISDQQLISLMNLAGFSVGVGEWRPERDGQFGRFYVDLNDVHGS